MKRSDEILGDFSRDERKFLQYAMFPFPRASVSVGVEFRLRLRCEDESLLRDEVKPALWGWLNFGGLGARTRRGCGALYCSQAAPPGFERIREWYTSAQNWFGQSAAERAWPTFETPLFPPEMTTSFQAWKESLKVMYEFRQGEHGRNYDEEGAPHRSRWPEADSLRRLTGKYFADHAPYTSLESPAFPRAALGLPMQFRFKAKEDGAGNLISNEDLKNNCQLYPVVNGKTGTRMASPIILRPLAIGGADRAVPMVLILHAPRPTGLQLKPLKPKSSEPEISERIRKATPLNQTAVEGPRLAEYSGSPLAADPGGSAVEAFRQFATSYFYPRGEE